MSPRDTTASETGEGRQRSGRLTAREREIVGLLADGMSGAEIAVRLFLSPETVRTHIRNAMGRLGASTRSQAVVLALQRDEIADRDPGDQPPRRAPTATSPEAPGLRPSPELDRALERLLANLCLLHDVEGGLVFLAEEDDLTLRRAAVVADDGAPGLEVPERIALGEGPLGKVALNRRAALLPSLAPNPSRPGTALAAPILANGHLLGVLGLTTRTSRPTGQSELLVLQAFVKRVGEVLRSGEDIDRRLGATAQRFGASWSAATN